MEPLRETTNLYNSPNGKVNKLGNLLTAKINVLSNNSIKPIEQEFNPSEKLNLSPQKVSNEGDFSNATKEISPLTEQSKTSRNLSGIEASNSNLEKIFLERSLLDDLSIEVKHYLLPYINNQIKAEEAKNAPPFFKLLTENLKEKYKEINQKKFEELAVYQYFFTAAQGLFMNLESNQYFKKKKKDRLLPPDNFVIDFNELSYSRRSREEKNQEFKELSAWYRNWAADAPRGKNLKLTRPVLILLQALAPAFKKDFPNSALNVDDTIELAIKVLKQVIAERIEIHKERLESYNSISREQQKIPEGTLTQNQVYQQIQVTYLKQFINEIIKELTPENRILFFSGASISQQEEFRTNRKYLKDHYSYKLWYQSNQKMQSYAPALTPQGLSIVNQVLEYIKKTFRRRVISPNTILNIIAEALNETK